MRILAAVLFLAACGSTAGMPDAASPPIDAPVATDAAPARLTPGQELTPAAGHLAGGGWTADVQLSTYHPHNGAPLVP